MGLASGPILGRVCGRYSLTKSPQEIGRHFGVSVPQGLQRPPSWNLRPTEDVLGIVGGAEGPALRLLQWGMFIPVASQAKPTLVINARAETAPEKRSFRELISKAAHRVIVPADGWYEWLEKQPYAFDVPDREVFGFAGLCKEVTIDGETRSASVILTCDPAGNRTASETHDRTPAVLADRREQQEWMDPGVGAEHAASLCRVLPESRLRRRRANPMLNRPDAEDGPHLLEAPSTKPEPPQREGEQLQLLGSLE
jgi:putative SOS response-associated peptidase YedK